MDRGVDIQYHLLSPAAEAREFVASYGNPHHRPAATAEEFRTKDNGWGNTAERDGKYFIRSKRTDQLVEVPYTKRRIADPTAIGNASCDCRHDPVHAGHDDNRAMAGAMQRMVRHFIGAHGHKESSDQFGGFRIASQAGVNAWSGRQDRRRSCKPETPSRR
jgi:hypothetical protein